MASNYKLLSQLWGKDERRLNNALDNTNRRCCCLFCSRIVPIWDAQGGLLALLRGNISVNRAILAGILCVADRKNALYMAFGSGKQTLLGDTKEKQKKLKHEKARIGKINPPPDEGRGASYFLSSLRLR